MFININEGLSSLISTMIDNSKEYILCAAVRRKFPNPNASGAYHEGTNDIKDIEIGYRHHDIYCRFNDRKADPMFEHCVISMNPYHQGFYTSKGRYVGRREGMKIAWEARQINDTRIAFVKDAPKIELNFVGDTIPDPPEIKDEWYLRDRQFLEYRPLASEDLY